MQHFVSTLTPEQVAIIAGIIAPVVHYLFDKWRSFSTGHNWLLSFLIPFLGTIAVFLSQNATFNQAFPLYATVYATGQLVYVIAVRYWKAANELKLIKAQAPESSF